MTRAPSCTDPCSLACCVLSSAHLIAEGCHLLAVHMTRTHQLHCHLVHIIQQRSVHHSKGSCMARHALQDQQAHSRLQIDLHAGLLSFLLTSRCMYIGLSQARHCRLATNACIKPWGLMQASNACVSSNIACIAGDCTSPQHTQAAVCMGADLETHWTDLPPRGA